MEIVMEKEMELINGDLLQLNDCMHRILDNASNMSGKFIYGMHKNVDKLMPLVKNLDKLRMNLIKDYAELDKNNEPKTALDEEGNVKFVYKKDNEKEASIAFNKLMSSPVNVDFHKINLSEFEKLEGLNPQMIKSLGAFIDLIIIE